MYESVHAVAHHPDTVPVSVPMWAEQPLQHSEPVIIPVSEPEI